MASEKLTVASSDPVSLEDTADKPALESNPVKTTFNKTADNEIPIATATKEKSDASELKTELKPGLNVEDTSHSIKGSKPPANASASTTVNVEVDVEDDAPPRPQRPLSPIARIKKDLKDAFPQIDDKYIHACLIASGGNADPAFSALLYLLDPTYEPEVVQAPPAMAQRPPAALTDDELLARQLQKEFDKEERKRRIKSSQRARRAAAPEHENESPDEFEQLKESFAQGFEEAKLTLNSWVSGISKNFSGDDSHDKAGAQNPKLFGALGGSSFNRNPNQKRTNFDDDPEILSLNFQRNLDMRDEAPALPNNKPQPAPKDAKWQPLNLDVPMSSDAFLVTDSEDEDKDGKKF